VGVFTLLNLEMTPFKLYTPKLFWRTDHGFTSSVRLVLGMVWQELAKAKIPAPCVLHVAVGAYLWIYFSIPGIFEELARVLRVLTFPLLLP
jgi:hypothetical protein